ncbi:MAG: A/G-specific adenine glycosylase [Anaerolineales bacterium]
MNGRAGVRLLRWYERHARRFPWRAQGSRRVAGYVVWVSEVMLQQTRTSTVVPYFRRWMREFPSLRSLAVAPVERVLAAWEGLGYYRRAHQIHRAARVLVRRSAGRMPQTADELRALPGIGPYTAAAIASIAYRQDEIALDGNLRRVLSRYFDVGASSPGKARDSILIQKAQSLLARGRAGDFNQALMDLGAQICTPRAPRCAECPLAESCLALRRGTQAVRRSPPRRSNLPHRTRRAAVVRRGVQVLLVRRPAGGLLAGLWEFPEIRDGRRAHTSARRKVSRPGLPVRLGRRLGVFHQTYSHFESSVYVFEASLKPGSLAGTSSLDRRWVATSRLDRFPMGRVDRRIAHSLLERGQAGPGGAPRRR